MNLFNDKNLSLKESFKSGIELYKSNIKLLTYISLLSFIVSFAYDTYDYLLNIFNVQAYSGRTTMISFIIFLAYVFLYSILTISIVYVTYKIYKKQTVDFKEAFNFSKKRFWKYFWTSVKFILIIVVPLMAEMIIYNLVQGTSIKIVLMLIFAVPLLYLVAIYNFAPVISCLEEFGEEEFLQSSRKLVKGYEFKIMILIFITQFLVWLPKYYFGAVHVFNNNVTYIINLLNQGVFIILNPIITATYIVIIDKLKEKILISDK